MKRITKVLCPLLIICMAWTPVSVQATMIGTEQVVQQQDSRDKVVQFMQREDVAKQLESYGISSADAQERVNAMTADEVNQLAANIDALPAGADTTLAFSATTWLVAAILILIVLYWWFTKREQTATTKTTTKSTTTTTPQTAPDSK